MRNPEPSRLLSVVIPAFNAAKTVASVIERIPAAAWQQIRNVYIIDDGSTDGTAAVLQAFTAANRRILPIIAEKNRGYGTTMQQGLQCCRNDGCSFALSLHADGQYPPESIQEFLKDIQIRQVDVLQGSRIASGTALSGGMPRYKYIAGSILTAMENRVFGLRMTDYHSGFLMYSRRLLESVKFENLSSSFDFDLEVIASARAQKLSVAELPIPTCYGDEVSYLNPITYGMRVLRVMGRYVRGGYRGVG